MENKLDKKKIGRILNKHEQTVPLRQQKLTTRLQGNKSKQFNKSFRGLSSYLIESISIIHYFSEHILATENVIIISKMS